MNYKCKDESCEELAQCHPANYLYSYCQTYVQVKAPQPGYRVSALCSNISHCCQWNVNR